MRLRLAIVSMTVAALAGCASAPERRNWFDDPFEQATQGLPDCPVPEGPLYTETEMRKQAHYRAERGTSCWLAGISTATSRSATSAASSICKAVCGAPRSAMR